MPWHSFEGDGATATTERYRQLVDDRKRAEREERTYRASRPQPVTEPEKVETPAKPKHKARRSKRPNDNRTRPRKRDKQGASRLRRQLHGALLYWHDAERAMVRDVEAAERRAESSQDLDSIVGPRRPRKRRK